MRKIGIGLLCVILSAFFPVMTIRAMTEAEGNMQAPVYDASFDQNKGAFFANGTPITIAADGTSTRISWESGSVLVPETVRVFGGGSEGTDYETSDITMTGGRVRNVFGGGFSLTSATQANVDNAKIVVENGTVTAGVYGGGLLYAKVNNTDVEIYNGDIQSVLGGGAASTSIDGVSYNSGTEAHPELSGTVVSNASVKLNGGNLYSVWGGGQGYSYTQNTDVVITGGTIDYVTAGGSNGLTDLAKIKITGGNINVYQSVNRGLVKEAETTVLGGSISTFYVGGETTSDVTGTLNGAKVNLLGGTIETLKAGTSNLVVIDITDPDYQVKVASGTVIDNQISEGTESFSYSLSFRKNSYKIPQKTPIDIVVEVKTIPEGYESLFTKDLFNYTISDDTVAMVNQYGTVIGLKDGNTILSASLYDHSATTEVIVDGVPINYILQAIFAVILGIVFIALLAVFIILKMIFNFLFKRSCI